MPGRSYSNIPAGSVPDTGSHNQHSSADVAAGEFTSKQLDLQNRYARPATFDAMIPDGSVSYVRPLPAVYASPTDDKQRFQFKEHVKRTGALAAAGAGQQSNWQVTDRDVDQMYSMHKSAQLYNYHKYLGKFIDLRRPGNLALLYRLEPEYINMKIKAFDAMVALEKRKAMIKNFGVQNTEDLRLKYLLDTRQLWDQRLQSDNYLPGFLVPMRNRGAWSAWESMFMPTREFRGEVGPDLVGVMGQGGMGFGLRPGGLAEHTIDNASIFDTPLPGTGVPPLGDGETGEWNAANNTYLPSAGGVY